MTRKMVKEEKELMEYFRHIYGGDTKILGYRKCRRLVTALVRAVEKRGAKALRIAAEEAYRSQVVETCMTEMESPKEEWIESIMEDWQEQAKIGGKK